MRLFDRPFIILERHGDRAWLWWALPVLLYSWTLFAPFVFDDLHLVLSAERYWSGESPEWSLFRLAPDADAWRDFRSRGSVPWWGHEATRIDFFRPLPAASFLLDTRLFGRQAPFYHAVSLALFALLLPCVHAAFRAAGGGPVHAGLATFFLGISQTLAQPVGIISNRSDLLVIIGLALATQAWWQSREHSGWGTLIKGVAGWIIALLSKESAIAFIAVIALDAWLTRPRSSGRSRTLIAYLLVALAYLAYYAATRMHAFSMSTDAPSPLASLPDAAANLPLYLAVWTIGFPIGILLQSGSILPLVVRCIGLLGAMAVIPALMRLARNSRPASFFYHWAVVFMFMALLTFPEARALSVATIGWTFLLVPLILRVDTPTSTQGVSVPDTPDLRVGPARRHMLMCANLVVALACGTGTLIFVQQAEQHARASLERRMAGLHLHDGDGVFFKQAESPLEPLCAGDRIAFHSGVRDLAVSYLAPPDMPLTVTRVDERTLRLTAPPPGPLGSPAHRLMLGARYRPRVGDRWVLRDFTATIDSLDEAGHAAALTLRFAEPLTGGRLHYIDSNSH